MGESRDLPRPGPDASSQFDLEWTEILDEIRVALPGVQLLFGFLLAAPFSEGFRQMSGFLRYGYFTIAPSVYHRLHWRPPTASRSPASSCSRSR